jgi:hypothetical protein
VCHANEDHQEFWVKVYKIIPYDAKTRMETKQLNQQKSQIRWIDKFLCVSAQNMETKLHSSTWYIEQTNEDCFSQTRKTGKTLMTYFGRMMKNFDEGWNLLHGDLRNSWQSKQ